MVMLSIALVIAAIVGAFVAGGALDRGFPVEVAIVRGAVAFALIAFTGYLSELVVVTAPPKPRAQPAPKAAGAAEPQAPPAPPQLIAPVQQADPVNEEDADVDLRPAA